MGLKKKMERKKVGVKKSGDEKGKSKRVNKSTVIKWGKKMGKEKKKGELGKQIVAEKKEIKKVR